LDLATSMHKE